jgi:hypothetical protein
MPFLFGIVVFGMRDEPDPERFPASLFYGCEFMKWEHEWAQIQDVGEKTQTRVAR